MCTHFQPGQNPTPQTTTGSAMTPQIVRRCLNLVQRSLTGLQRLWAHLHALRRYRVARHWVIVLRLLIALLVGLTVQNQQWSPDVLTFSMIALVLWAVVAPHPDQWKG